MNKKGQITGILYFFAVIIGIFIISIVMLKVINTTLTPFSSAIGNVSANAGASVSAIQTKTGGLWDTVVMMLFALNILILLVSSFLIDIHPMFVLVYIFAVFLLIIFAPNVLYSVEQIWGSASYSTEAGQMPMTQFLINNFVFILLGIIVLSGVVMYAKIKFFNQGAGGSY